MREMKDSGIEWIGEIPIDWNCEKMLYVLRTQICDGPHETPIYVDDGIPFISVDSLNETKKVNLLNVKKFITEKSYNLYMNKAHIENGDILFSKAATIGKTAIVGNEKFMVWSPLAIIKSSPDLINNIFLYYLLNCEALIDNIRLSGSFNTQANVGMREMERAKIPVPSMQTQQIIASFLDEKCSKIDSLVNDIQTQITTLEEYKKSVITEAVTKGLDSNVEMKDSGIEGVKEIPSHWQVKRAKYICESLFKGNGITKDDIKDDGDICCIRYGEIYSKYNGAVTAPTTLTNISLVTSPKRIKKGDLLFAGTGELIEEIGKNIVYMGNSPCLAGGDIIIMRHSQNPIFLNYTMNSVLTQIQKSKGKAKLKVVHISATDIGNLFVAMPPLEEQQQIADYLDSKCSEIDAIIQTKKEQLDVLAEYKKSLIYEYVTGKKEVK